MFAYHIIVLFLCWPYARGAEETESQDEPIFDQIATASENIVKIVKTVPPPSVATSIHYENSNGFLPMTPPSVTQRYKQQLELISFTTHGPENVVMDQENSTVSMKLTRDFTSNVLKGSDELENDLVYSPEARIFLDLPHSDTNRRSFEFRDDQNTFELLKVHNDTPAIANYNDFYENIDDDLTAPDDNDEETSSGNESKRDRGKRIDGSYATSYGTATDQNTETDDSYGHYYSSYAAAKDEKKRTSHKPEKVTSNYHQRNTVNYNGHGQSAARQKITAEASASSRTNYEGNESNRKSGSNYDNAAVSSSKTHHKFTKPVVVAEPKDYQIEMKFGGQSSKSFASSSRSQNNVKLADATGAESTNVYNRYHQDARGRSYDRTDDSSDDSNDSMDYMDYTEKPRRVHKSKRRPYSTDTSRRLPKEHRGLISEDSMESDNYRKRPTSTRSRPHRQRAQSTTIWIEDDRNHSEDESTEERPHESRVHSSTTEMKHAKSQQHFKPRPSNTWSQLGPNIEISHSSGIEIDPSEKSNLVIPVGLMSIANFDHATALGNSQGFDVSNVVYQNLVTPTPGGSASTATTPLLGPHQATIGQNIVATQNVPRTFSNIQNVGLSTPIPEIIVGQNSFQNPTHTVLVPQQNLPNKIQQNSNTQYVSSTISPVFAVTTRLAPTLQNFRVQSIPNNVTPRPAFATTSPGSNLQQITVNHVQPGISHLLVPQPTVQTLSNLIQAPTHASPEYNIQVNPHGLQGQNVIAQNNLQMPHYPVQTATTQSSPVQPVTRVNLITAETQNKKTLFPATGGSILASASFTVGQNHQVQSSNDNSYAPQNVIRTQVQDNSYRLTKDDDTATKTKTYLQNANLVPFYHPVPPVDGINFNQQTNLYHVPTSQNPQNVNVLFPRFPEQNSHYQNALHQLQLQLQQQQNQVVRNNKFTNYPYQMSDAVGSQTINNVHVAQDNNFAHLPKMGTKNVEILNPNIKPSPVDTTITNPLQTIQHYPVVTTQIPILSTTPISFNTPSQSNHFQNYINSITESGTKTNQQSSSTMDMKTAQNQEKPIFNPINFVPSIDVIKNQNALNSKLQNNEGLQQSLNLVPLMPGGNFFKPSFSAQSELITKPKLTSDLEKYAEEMFKESLKTIYNSQKWNNDRKIPLNNQTNLEPHDIAALKNELMKLKAALPDTRQNKEILEAYQSENKLRTTEATKSSNSGNDKKKPDPLLATLEELLKAQSSEQTQTHHGHRHNHHHGHKRPHSSNTKHLREFLTPPKQNSFHSQSHYHDKSKKRPGSAPPRFNHHSHSHGHSHGAGRNHNHFDGPRPHSKPSGLNPKSIGPEASASNVDGVRTSHPDFKKSHSIDDYTFTTSTPNLEELSKFLSEFRSPSNTEHTKQDINHPRMHNLLSLLMKNKQLPPGSSQSYFRNTDQLRQFFEDEKRRLQEQFYDDTLRSYLENKSDNVPRFIPRPSIIGSDRIYANGAA